MDKIKQASELLERFASDTAITPVDAERLVVGIFEACGHTVTQKGFAESDEGVDCFVRTHIDGKLQTIGVEVKAGSRPAGIASVNQALNLNQSDQFDRAMVISRSGFTAEAFRHADTLGLGRLDLLGPGDLRNWLAKQVQTEEADSTYDSILRTAMRKLTRLIAEHPENLAKLEWRELEKVLREALEGIGFDTRLTRPGKDGGFDLELTNIEVGRKQTYLVEVKHWINKKPGPSHLRKFISVTASQAATGGLLLSTSGFAGTIYSGITEFSTPVRLGGGNKVISLCKTYYRLRSALWLEDINLKEILLSGTQAIGEYEQASESFTRADYRR